MYFDKKLCMFQQKFENQNELFEAMFNKMYKAGVVKEDYLAAVKEREENYPTGLLVGNTGFAIPHTDSKPVEFANMGDKNDIVKVELVFMLAMSQPHEQVQTLQNLIALFQDEDAIKKLKECNSEEDFINILNEKEIY